MKVWYDACTGKHVRYGAAIAKRLRGLGCEVLLTTRLHPDTTALAHLLNEEFTVAGRYVPSTLDRRLKASLKRQMRLCSLVERWQPDFAVSHQSVELCRVAFGLQIPVVCTADSPHSWAVNRLTLPLAGTVVASEAVPRRLWCGFGVHDLVQFKGVDEAAWIKSFKPSPTGLESDSGKPLIVVRQIETQASYAAGKEDLTYRLALKLTSLGDVVFLSRYKRLRRKGLTVPESFVDSANLAAAADLVVSVGGTIAREAALQGTPSMVVSVFDGLYVNDYLRRLGFPLVTVKAERAVETARRMLGCKVDVREKLKSLENPVDVIVRVLGLA